VGDGVVKRTYNVTALLSSGRLTMQIGQRHQAYGIFAHALHPILRIGSKYKYNISLTQRQFPRTAGLIVEQGSRLIPPFDSILSL